VFLELLSVYRDWQEEKAQTICKKQEDIEYKIEVADALATSPKFKPLSFHNEDCFTTFSRRRLTEVLSNYEALCNRIAAEGPEPLRSIEPFAVSTSNSTSVSSGK
ncbi:hypothetical protein Goari_006099, partial [Gossypium aridum]|nr:hypothetical protein [Gossypium aridum]